MTVSLDALRDRIAASGAMELQPVATPEQVAAFEKRLGTPLPDDFRTFLLEVGDGIWVDGEPCLYGIEAVLADLGKGDASRPFPYGDDDASRLREAMAAVPPRSTLMESARFMALQKKSPWGEGAITVASNGGNDFCTLVLSGPQRRALVAAVAGGHVRPVEKYLH